MASTEPTTTTATVPEAVSTLTLYRERLFILADDWPGRGTQRLTRELGDAVGVWPFEGLGDPGTPVVLAETWFGLWDWRAERHPVRDAKQVAGTLKALRGLGPSGLAGLLNPPSVAALPADRRRQVLDEEGWTLGVA